MNLKHISLLVALILLCVGVYVYFVYLPLQNDTLSCTGETMQCADGTFVARMGPNCAFASCTPVSAESVSNGSVVDKAISWSFKDEGTETSSGIPKTRVFFSRNELVTDLGAYDGSCSEIHVTSWALLAGEVSGVICWWAGGGKELGLFYEGSVGLIKVGTLDEGTAEVPGFRGDFREIFRF